MSNNFKGFCKKVEKAKIKSDRQKLFRLIVRQTGDFELAKAILKQRPYSRYIPGKGTLLTTEPDIDPNQSPIVKIPL